MSAKRYAVRRLYPLDPPLARGAAAIVVLASDYDALKADRDNAQAMLDKAGDTILRLMEAQDSPPHQHN